MWFVLLPLETVLAIASVLAIAAAVGIPAFLVIAFVRGLIGQHPDVAHSIGMAFLWLLGAVLIYCYFTAYRRWRRTNPDASVVAAAAAHFGRKMRPHLVMLVVTLAALAVVALAA